METELSEELRFHVERQIAESIATGITPDDARRAALSELGGIEHIKEDRRDMRRTQWLETALQDGRFGIRTFRKRPAFTLSVLAILAFGVGSATAIFSNRKRRFVDGAAVPRSGESRPHLWNLGARISRRHLAA